MMSNFQRTNFKANIFLLLLLISACSKNIEDCSQYDSINIETIQSEDQVIAHSHNDYEQTCPLTKALNLGFTSIEVDIFPFKETIVVSHEDDLLDIKPTIQSMYLDPLRDILNNNQQKINLLIDLKVNSEDFLNQLHIALKAYDDILTTRTNNNKIKVILSGNLPREDIINNDEWVYFFIDGRLTDLGKNIDSHLMPLVSANFSNIFDFNPSQILSRDEIEHLSSLIQLVHDEDKIIRFWNTSDSEIMWSQLIEIGVDVIGVDDLDGFHEFVGK